MEKLQRKFEINKGRAEVLIEQASDLMESDSHDRAEVDHCVEQLDHYYTVLSGLGDEIIDQLVGLTDAAFSAEAGTAALVHVEKVSRQRRKLANFQQKFQADTGSVSSSHTTSHRRTASSRLPKLELPRFKGDPLKWVSFWDAFESSIHSNEGLTSVEKFNYLNSLLQGPAADATAPISVTNDNYQTAVDLIKERFGKKEIIVSSHVDALLKIPRATGTVASLRKVYDLCEIHIGGLRALGIGSDMYGVIVAPIILSKLPEEVKLVLTRKNRAAVWKLDDLRVLLQEEVENREWVSDSSKVSSSKSEGTVCGENKVTTSLVSGVSYSRSCVFCKDASHPSWKCYKVIRIEDRLQRAKEQRLCFNCLRPGHSSSQCKSSSTCHQCHKKHHTALCYGTKTTDSGTFSRRSSARSNTTVDRSFSSKVQPVPVPQQLAPTTTASAVVKESTLILQTATMYVASSEGGFYRIVRVVFDQGSHRTFVREGLYNELRLKSTGQEDISIGSFRSNSDKSERFTTTMMISHCVDGSTQELHAVVVPELIVSLYRAQVQPEVLQSFGNIYFADSYAEASELVDVDILIGVDQYWEFVTGEVLRGMHGLIAMNSKVGWLLSGHDVSSQAPSYQCQVFLICDNLRSKNQCLERLWKLEAIRIKDSDQRNGDIEEEVLVNFNKTIEYRDGRYEVNFPWNGREDKLAWNYELSRKRLVSLIKRLEKTNQIQSYDDVISDQLRRGFIERVNEPEKYDGVVHYIPHHPVIKADHATTKIRIVYDCSAKAQKDGLSLNDCLYKGVPLVDNLVSILLRFRCHKVALIADIEKAFLQIQVREEDRDATRFLWLSNSTSLSKKVNESFTVYRFRRVLFGASASPFLLNATLKYHLERSLSLIAVQLLGNFYVDNLLTGTDSNSTAVEFHHEAKSLMMQAGMNLREWNSNSAKVVQQFPEKDRMKEGYAGVLGLLWNTANDTLHVKSLNNYKPSDAGSTKRDALRAAALIFDPLGFVSPVTIQGKVLMQDLWVQGIGWDDPLSLYYKERLHTFIQNFRRLNVIEVPRRFDCKVKSSQLHIFVDASIKAYAAVAYLVGESQEGDAASSFVMSKARVAPLKELTLPKLELMAAYLGTEMGAFIRESIDVAKVTVWSDSQITLSWIRSKKQLQPFVRNRVNKMREKSFTYRFCPSSDNVADIPSRGLNIEALASRREWLHGPTWLTDSSKFPRDLAVTESSTAEVKITTTNAVSSVTSEKTDSSPFGIDEGKYSSFQRILAVTSCCLRFVEGLKGHRRPSSIALEAGEIAKSKMLWERHIQTSYFKEEPKVLTDQLKKRLRMFEDEDRIVRCRARLDNADLPYDAKFPKFLPKKRHFTELIIKQVHERLFHQGVRHVVYTLRQEYWIPQIRQVLKKVLKSCFICKLWDAKPYCLPDPPPLPSLRVTENSPFSFVGCDFAGPLYHRIAERESEKCYVCIFTCAVTRAVHLELVRSLSAEDFIMCFRRFTSRRGKPIEVVSDNAKTFVTASIALDELWKEVVTDEAVLDYAGREGIRWKFNVPRAPWWGGFFERLVKSVKISLKKAIGKSVALDFTKVETVLIEVEAILNSRPLTFVYSEEDSGKALSPSDFLGSGSQHGLPQFARSDQDPDYTQVDTNAKVLLKKLQRQQRALDSFWKIWRNEYLTSLQEIQRYKVKSSSAAPAAGDVVLLKEDIPRGRWKRCLITKILSSSDGSIRAATVKVGDRLYTRPINLLVPLEVKASSDLYKVEAAPQSVPCPEVQSSNSRPRRDAAVRALSRIAEWTKSDSEDFNCHNGN